jgi:sec-independent protein translocase protein TatB
MFDIGWSEMAVIAVVALLVIGPKDLPKVLRTVGQWVSKARAMAREFQSSIDEMARDADLEELKKTAREMSQLDIKGEIQKTVDPSGELEKSIAEVNALDPGKPPFEAPRQPLPEPAAQPALPEPVGLAAEPPKAGTAA